MGKTRFAIATAGHFPAEIVGADSMQLYRRMDIGTAKPTPAEKAAVPHHMVDILDPDQAYDAGRYGEQAHRTVQALLERGVTPFVVGGTGLYIKALIYGLVDELPSDPATRRHLQLQAEQKGSDALHAQLAERDPRAAARIHPNDTYRIVRALEVLALTGRSISSLQQRHAFARPRYTALNIGLRIPREKLYARIDRRVDAMLEEGLLQEVSQLIESGIAPDAKPMQSLGYRHMVAYLQGRLSWEEAVRTLKRDHRRYAKRQFTWFGALDNVHWMSPDQVADACRLIRDFLSDTPGS